jgi:putative component of membrane protein insertase Oxa1/YidC/SpoIIIJ protein YidD
MGAIYVDGGMNEVVRVYKHIISPLLLYVAKFTKQCYGEAKE